MKGFVWNAKELSLLRTVAPESKNSQIDKKSSDTRRPIDSAADRSTA